MAHESFSITYDGPALIEGRMAVKDLAPALLDLGELFIVSGRLLYPEHKPVALTVTATHEGSFVIDLGLEAAGLWSQLTDLLTGETTTAVSALLGFVAGGGGLLALVKRVKGRTITSRQPTAEPGQVLIRFDDGSTLIVSEEVLRLYEHGTIRRKIPGVVTPLQREGIDTMSVEVGGEETVEITEQDVPSYALPAATAITPTTSDTELLLDVSTASFTTENKWRFDDGTKKFAAVIEDTDFLKSVGDGEPFSAGDRLRAVVRTTQMEGPNGLQATHALVKIVDHVKRAHQFRIDETPPAGPEDGP